jgi:hypothetical protein
MPAGYAQCLVTAQGDGSALTNTTTATSILPTQGKYTLGATFLPAAGASLMVKAWGRASTAASSPGNITFDVRFGSIVVATSQAMALATSQTTDTWRVEMNLTTRAVGGSTTANMLMTGEAKSLILSGGPLILIPATAPAVGNGFDSTAAQQVDFFVTWSTASASNTITLHGYELWSIGP